MSECLIYTIERRSIALFEYSVRYVLTIFVQDTYSCPDTRQENQPYAQLATWWTAACGAGCAARALTRIEVATKLHAMRWPAPNRRSPMISRLTASVSRAAALIALDRRHQVWVDLRQVEEPPS